jgi:hypothetical protein
MSHIVSIQCELKSLEAIHNACQRLGWTLKQGQRTYRWFGRWMDDTPLPEQLLNEAEIKQLPTLHPQRRQELLNNILGRCDHAIQIPGASYEIGHRIATATISLVSRRHPVFPRASSFRS